MTINLKPLIKTGMPKYLAISDALESAISRGDLKPGSQLPTHRDLAEHLGVSVQTVSNAYAHAEKKGVVEACVGSGTFVSDYPVEKEAKFMLIEGKEIEEDAIDFSLAHPVCTVQHSQHFNDALIKIAHSDTDLLIRAPTPVQGLKHHIEAVAQWLTSQKLPVETDRIILSNGGSHGLTLALSTVVKPGDLIACENLCDHGLIARARILNCKLLGLECDREGIIPESFEAACQKNKIRVLSCTPSMSNPTSAHMGLERRKKIAELAVKYNVLVIEDDVYGALEPNRIPPLSSFIPDQAFYITSLTKTVAPGLRVGFMVVPRHFMLHTTSRLAASSWMATPMLFEVATLWIKDGTLQNLIEFEQQEFAARQKIAQELLGDFEYDAHPNGMHIWLHLPEGWSPDELVASALQANLIITGDQPFIVTQGQQLNRVRISLGMESSRQRIEHGLTLLANLLSSPPPPTYILL